MNIIFKPVEVVGGRKFKGKAYDLGNVSYYSVAYGVECQSAKLWDPESKKVVFATPKFMKDRDADESEISRDLKAYVDKTFDDTISWCKIHANIKTDSEIMRFARNCMLKKYPDWKEEIDQRLPDSRQAIDEVEKTLDWAMKRKTRAVVLYGKMCPGGKDLPEKKKILIAISSLKHRHIVDLDGFEDAWAMALTLRGLQKYIPLLND